MSQANGHQEYRKFQPGDMQYRFLGKTGLKVSALSFGSWVTGESSATAFFARIC